MKWLFITLAGLIGLPILYSSLSLLSAQRSKIVQMARGGVNGVTSGSGDSSKFWWMYLIAWLTITFLFVIGTDLGRWMWEKESAVFWSIQIATAIAAILFWTNEGKKGVAGNVSATLAVALIVGVSANALWEYAYFAENQRNAEAQAKLENMVYGEKGNPFLPRIPPNGPLEVVVTRTKHDFNYHPRVPVAFDVTHSMGDTFIMTFEMKGEKEFVPVTFSGDGNVTLPRGFYRIREIWTEGEKEQVSVTFNFAAVDT